MKKGLTAPLLFLIFNRPDTTQRVFEAIREAQPRRLYVAADGPRKERSNEHSLCVAVRSIATSVDWPCELFTLYRTDNLGCRHAVSSAITWFFERETEGIILEDDCLPDPTFFTFCETLLENYREDTRVMHIGGSNFQQGRIRGDGSYYFSRYPHIWGWASWRRAWKLYDRDLKTLNHFIEQGQIRNIFTHPALQKAWLKAFLLVASGNLDTWDHQWTYAVFSHNGLCVLPNQNLVSNIGFGPEARHTIFRDPRIANLPTTSIGALIHPTFMIADRQADEFTTLRTFRNSTFSSTKQILSKYFRKVVPWASLPR
jgi:hypothetical protein